MSTKRNKAREASKAIDHLAGIYETVCQGRAMSSDPSHESHTEKPRGLLATEYSFWRILGQYQKLGIL
jgi:hypothetical protein